MLDNKLERARRTYWEKWECEMVGSLSFDETETAKLLQADKWQAREAFDEAIDSTRFLDRQIPWPRSHLFKESDMGGPISYSVRAVVLLPDIFDPNVRDQFTSGPKRPT